MALQDVIMANARLNNVLKVKSDHCSKFSNLCNWKEEAWKKTPGFNGIRTRDLRDTGAVYY